MYRTTLLACLLTAFLSSAIAAADSNRFALVIGNGGYEQGQLKNPANDAKLISQSLEHLGFQVETKLDLDQQEMEETISSFSRRLPKNSFAFFFFAGHGIQAKKANYLIPVGAQLSSESSLKYRTVPLDFVRDELENSRSNLNVVVLDCCRNNPFERSWNRTLGQRGFAPVPPVPEGTVIAFATGAGKTAADGQGDNSPYTRELASALSARPSEGLSLVEGVFFTLGRTLKPKTQQHPHLYVDSTMPKYYLWKPSADEKGIISPNSEPTQPSYSASAPKPAFTQPNIPSVKSTHGHGLLAQALQYHSEGEFDYAITAFGALITDPDVARDVRDQARKGRGGSYLAKGTAESINRAIIDFKAAREPGIQLSVMRSEAELRDAKVVTGKVHRNEIVLLTQSRGDWLWVESVQGSKSRQGWIKCSAFLATPESTSSTAVSIVLPNKASASQSTSAVKKAEPLVQPLGTSSVPFTPSTASTTGSTRLTPSQSSSMTSFGPNGNPIGTIPRQSSQKVSLPTQSLRNNAAAQQTVFDQYGNPISQWSQSPNSRTVQSYRVDQFGNRISSTQQRQTGTSQQSNIVYVDQNGRQVIPGNQTTSQQRVYQPQQQTYQPQQQSYKPQQQTYKPQQQTFRTQQSNSNGFGNQNRSPFQFQNQNQGGKIFQSPMRSHMNRMKSVFGN